MNFLKISFSLNREHFQAGLIQVRVHAFQQLVEKINKPVTAKKGVL